MADATVRTETPWCCTDVISEEGCDRGYDRGYDRGCAVTESVADTMAAAAIKSMT